MGRQPRIHEPHPRDETRPWCGARNVVPARIIERYDYDPDADLDLMCESCSRLEGDAWDESMRHIFGSPSGMSDDEREVMGYIWGG